MMVALVLFTIKLVMVVGVGYWVLNVLLSKYLNSDIHPKNQGGAAANDLDKMALKLKAYERLVLYSERISIPKLIQRIKVPGMTSDQLKIALYIAIQQEYDHNITQQIYVSDKLWSILDLTRQQTLNHIGLCADQLDKSDKAEALEELLYDGISQMGGNPVKKAQEAIAAETKLVFA